MKNKVSLKDNYLIKRLIIDFLGVITLACVAILWQTPKTLALILILISLAMLYILKEKSTFLVFIFCSFAGAIAEIIGIYFGAWTYSKANFLGIPYWLIPLWGIAALYMINLNESIKYILKVK